MKKIFLLCTVLFSLSAIALFGETVTPVFASSDSVPNMRISTYITLKKLPTVKLGDSFDLTGNIKDAYGRPVADKSILFGIGDEYLGQVRSDKDGNFQWKFNKELDAGTYIVTASSNLTTFLAGTSSSITLNIAPTEVQIQTVPAIPGVTFQMNGKTFLSREDGSASIEIGKIGKYRLEVLTDKYSKPSEKIEFGRWLEESYQPFQDVQVPTDKVIQVGLNVYHLVGQSFVDLDGNPVDPSRVTKFTIRSIQGDVFELTDGQPRWIPSSRIARRVNGLEESKLLYSVIDVMVDGSNVVNKSQQRFYANPGDIWQISLLFYSMRLDARDGLFGNPLGDSVNLQYPDGTVKNYPLGQDGVAEIHSLPRGIYTIEFVGIKGMSNRTPVALSRDQEVHTKVITYVDMSVAVMAGMLLALGLLFYGRPGLIRGLIRRKQTVLQEPKTVPEPEPRNVDLPVPTPVLADVASPASIVSMPEPVAKTVLEPEPKNVDFPVPTPVLEEIAGPASFVSVPEPVAKTSRDRFEAALILMRGEWSRHGKNAKLSPEEQLMLTLVSMYGKHSKIRLGKAYGVSKTTVRRTIQRVNAVLARVDAQASTDPEMTPSEEVVEEVIETGMETENPGAIVMASVPVVISDGEIVPEEVEMETEHLLELPDKVVEAVYDN